MAITTVIFDFDGTIADSFAATLETANRLAPEFSYRPVQPHEVEMLRGRSYREVADYVGMAWHKVPLIALRIRKEVSSTIPKLPIVVGLGPVLSELRKHFSLGIMTSNSHSNVRRFLTAHGIDAFDFVKSASDIWGKERCLKALLKARRLRADEVAYVGDEVRDIEATRPLSVRMVAVGWGYTATQLLASHSPDHLIAHPEELVQVLKSYRASVAAAKQEA